MTKLTHRRNPRAPRARRANPLDPIAVLGIVAGSALVAGGVIWYVIRPKSAPIEGIAYDVTGGGRIEIPVTPSGPTPKPIAPATLPDVILAGGVPLDAGAVTVGWYRYPPTGSGYQWIRIDQIGALSRTDAGVLTVIWRGTWRWTVVGGEATPIATEIVELEIAAGGGVSRETIEDHGADLAARRAADWIGIAYGGTA